MAAWRAVAAAAAALLLAALYCVALQTGGRAAALRQALAEEDPARGHAALPSAYAARGGRGGGLRLRYTYACPAALAEAACLQLARDAETDAWLEEAEAEAAAGGVSSALAAVADRLLAGLGVGRYTRGALLNRPRLFLLSAAQWRLLALGGERGEGHAGEQLEEGEGSGVGEEKRAPYKGEKAHGEGEKAHGEGEKAHGEGERAQGEGKERGEGGDRERWMEKGVAEEEEEGSLLCLDVGAGLGWVTARAAVQLCGVEGTTAVEANAALAWRLAHNTGVRTLAEPALSQAALAEAGLPQRCSLLFLLNVLDRVAAPAAFLAELRPLLAPGGRLLVSLPLPWLSYAQEADDALAIAGASWEEAAAAAVEAFRSIGWQVERLARAPYLCTGSAATPLHVLDAALFRLAPLAPS